MSIFKTSDGTEIYFEDWHTPKLGKASAKPLVFIHGWPLSGAMWEYQMVPLAEAGFRCISYDRRGFGRSGKPYAGYDYATLGGDLAGLLDHLDLRDVTLVGFSMGGGEVVEVLARHAAASRVSKAILVSSIVPYMLQTDTNPDGVPADDFDGMRISLKSDRPAFLTDFTEAFFGVGMLSSPVSTSMLAASCEVAMRASPIATLECMKSFSSTDFRADLARITVPTLIIHGDADKTVPIAPTGKAAAEAIPNAELAIYSGAPHGLFYTHRHELNSDIAAFVSEGEIVLEAAA